jgi:excisionase family DNA binding protein
MQTDQEMTATGTTTTEVPKANDNRRRTRTPRLREGMGLLRVRQLAEALGLPVRTVYKLADEGDIPSLWLAGCYFFDQAAVEKALQRRAKERSADDRRYFK